MNTGPLSIIAKGSYVKYFLRNGMILEGIVEEDTASQVVLRSIDGESLMIIHRPAEDILLTKVMLTDPISDKKIEPNLTEAQEKIKTKLQEVQQAEIDPELQEKNITELRDMVREQERQIMINRKREHFGTPGSAKRNVPYSNPQVDMLRKNFKKGQ